MLRGGLLRKESVMNNKYVADIGFVFAKADLTEVYDNVLYLGKYDDPKNYVQITVEEAKEIKEKLEKQEQ